VEKIRVVTHNIFTNTDQSGDLEESDQYASVGRVSVRGSPRRGEVDSPKRGQFNKLFKEGINQQATRKRQSQQGSPQYGLDQDVFRITFNKGNVRITARDIKECSKPLAAFVDEGIAQMVDDTCVDAEHSIFPDSERMSSRNLRPIKLKN